MPDGEVCSVVKGAKKVLARMREFYSDYPVRVQKILDFEEKKIIDEKLRYAWQIRQQYGKNYVKKGMELAKERQKACVNCIFV